MFGSPFVQVVFSRDERWQLQETWEAGEGERRK